MKQIKLTQGKFALVDDSDYEELSKFKWCAVKGRHTFYATGKYKCLSDGKRHKIYMHRQIMNTSRGIQTDHQNSNGLDNQRSNLRICTHSQNIRNQHKDFKETSSKYKGVYFKKSLGKWVTQIGQNFERIYLGCFSNEVDAALAYDKKAKELFGEYAYLNFQEKKCG